jgi:vacuolar protein sorting-associated protein IST1
MRLFTTYNPTKLKTQLKMAITRLQIANNKKSALTKQQIREIATLLAETPPKEEKARIKAEALIRDDNTVEACEILALTCELLSERISLVTHSRDCPADLISSVSTLIWASAVVDVPELIEIRKQFRYKWGKEFEMDAMQNVGGVINERVAAKLSVHPPSAYLVQLYLERIADEHQVTWKAKQVLTAENMAEPTVPPVGVVDL